MSAISKSFLNGLSFSHIELAFVTNPVSLDENPGIPTPTVQTMAGYISKAGHNVTVYNRTGAKADKWIAEYKGSKADTPAKAAEGADFIFTCVGNDNDLREVSLGENGLFKTAKEGCVYVDNSTVSAEISRELYAAAKEKGFGFLDAPISGGQAGAEGGILTVMVGGDEDCKRHIYNLMYS